MSEPLPAPGRVADLDVLERMHDSISGEASGQDDAMIHKRLRALELRFRREHPANQVPSPLKLICWAIGRELQFREATYDFGASTLALQEKATSLCASHGHLRIGLMAVFDRLAARRAQLLSVANPDNELIAALDDEERRLLETSRVHERSFQHLRRTVSRSLASARSAALSTAFVDTLDFTKLATAKNRTIEPRIVGGLQDSFLMRMNADQISRHNTAPGLRIAKIVRGTQLPIHWRANTDVYRVSRGPAPSISAHGGTTQDRRIDARSFLEHAWRWIWDSTPEHRRYTNLGSFLNWLTCAFGQQDLEKRDQAMAAGTAYLLSRAGRHQHR